MTITSAEYSTKIVHKSKTRAQGCKVCCTVMYRTTSIWTVRGYLEDEI